MPLPPAMIATDAEMYPGPTKWLAKDANWQLSAIACVIFVASGLNQVHADAYTNLDAAAKAYVTRLCMPVQHMKNTASFRECVTQHSKAIAESSVFSAPSLNVDERIALIRACNATGNQNPDCTPEATTTARTTASAEEASTVITAESGLSADQGAVLSAPAAALPSKPVAGTTARNNLVNNVANALDTVTGDDAVDIPVQTVAIPAAPSVPRTPTTSNAGAVATDDNTSRQLKETVRANPRPNDTTKTTIVLAQNTTQSSSESAAPTTLDSGTAEDTASDIDSEGFDKSEAPLDIAKRLWAQLLSSIEGVSGVNRIILLSAAGLPILLIAFWLLMRGRKKEPEYIPPPHPGALRDRVRAYHDDELDDTLDTAADHSVASQQTYEEQAKELFADEADPVLHDDIDETVAIQQSMTPAGATAINDEFDYEAEAPAASTPIVATHAKEDMRSWLNNFERDEQLSIAIEFMIYWMAYTDERYQPELKKSVLAMEDPDEHDLVKRRVLNQDTAAFAQTTAWLQDNASAEQRVQIIKLLMALLVSEESLTPVQNTMLRFLANAFGMSHETLNEFFHTAFAESLPPMPRPDKPSWWEQQSEDKLKRWDARSVAQQSQTIQSRVKLGLPLTGSLDADELQEKYERAISRCHPGLFDLLSEREQVLAEQQQHKFDAAFDTLKERLA